MKERNRANKGCQNFHNIHTLEYLCAGSCIQMGLLQPKTTLIAFYLKLFIYFYSK